METLKESFHFAMLMTSDYKRFVLTSGLFVHILLGLTTTKRYGGDPVLDVGLRLKSDPMEKWATGDVCMS